MIVDYLKNIAFFIVIAIFFKVVSANFESKFLMEFLEDDLISILITVFAINTATNSLLIADLANLSKAKDIKFKNSYNQIKISITEQLIIIILGFLLLIIIDSGDNLSNEIKYIVETLLISTFIYSLDILRDTAMAVFKLIEFRNKE
ncbi:MAG: hypothetical protein IPH94_01555 [Saprospiraceae bacterium]|nr:hypothetical protein [Saprospiraceae bacterium]